MATHTLVYHFPFPEKNINSLPVPCSFHALVCLPQFSVTRRARHDRSIASNTFHIWFPRKFNNFNVVPSYFKFSHISIWCCPTFGNYSLQINSYPFIYNLYREILIVAFHTEFTKISMMRSPAQKKTKEKENKSFFWLGPQAHAAHEPEQEEA